MTHQCFYTLSTLKVNETWKGGNDRPSKRTTVDDSDWYLAIRKSKEESKSNNSSKIIVTLKINYEYEIEFWAICTLIFPATDQQIRLEW